MVITALQELKAAQPVLHNCPLPSIVMPSNRVPAANVENT